MANLFISIFTLMNSSYFSGSSEWNDSNFILVVLLVHHQIFSYSALGGACGHPTRNLVSLHKNLVNYTTSLRSVKKKLPLRITSHYSH